MSVLIDVRSLVVSMREIKYLINVLRLDTYWLVQLIVKGKIEGTAEHLGGVRKQVH